MIKTSVDRSETLECGECHSHIYTCDGCKEYFTPEMDCYCGENGKHYCENCKIK